MTARAAFKQAGLRTTRNRPIACERCDAVIENVHHRLGCSERGRCSCPWQSHSSYWTFRDLFRVPATHGFDGRRIGQNLPEFFWEILCDGCAVEVRPIVSIFAEVAVTDAYLAKLKRRISDAKRGQN